MLTLLTMFLIAGTTGCKPKPLRGDVMRSKVTTVLNNLRLLDSAKDQYAIENNRTDGIATGAQVKDYLKQGSPLQGAAARTGQASTINDPTHSSITYRLNSFDRLPSVEGLPEFMWEITDVGFWSPFEAR